MCVCICMHTYMHKWIVKFCSIIICRICNRISFNSKQSETKAQNNTVCWRELFFTFISFKQSLITFSDNFRHIWVEIEKNSTVILNRMISGLIVRGHLIPSMIEAPALANLIIDTNHTFGVYGYNNLDCLLTSLALLVLTGFSKGVNRWSFVLSTATHPIHTYTLGVFNLQWVSWELQEQSSGAPLHPASNLTG